ncbi:hypothetical protein SC346_10090, partial [Actinotignum timonense]|nr:hypothetical protein [Actinotignum timonense]
RIAHALRAALAEPVEQRWGIDEVVAALADPVSWYDDAATAPRALPTQLDATVPAALPGAAAPSYNATDSVPSAFPETWPQPIYAGSATAPYPEASAYQQAAPGPAAPATAPYPEASAYQQAVPGPAAPFASQPEAAPYPGAAPLEPAPLE